MLVLSTVYYSLFVDNSVLECLVNLSLNTSLSLLFLRTVAGDDLLGLSEVGSDDLRILELSDTCKVRVVRWTDLCREVL